MKNKYISKQSNQLLTYFIGKGMNCFEYDKAFQALPDSSVSAVRELLSDMTRRGLLMRIKEGIYYIIPYEADAESYMPDWHLVADCLVGDITHYIGYYSALQIHNLITQPSLKEQVVVSRQIKPSVITIKKVPFQLIFHNSDHFFGYKKIWIDNFHKVECSDLEKTFIDCLFKPSYAGGVVEIAKAMYQARTMIDYDKLFTYSIRFKSQAVKKRLGFLLEILEIGQSIIPDLLKAKTASFVLLDTELPKAGKMISRWSIQQNIESDTIKQSLFT